MGNTPSSVRLRAPQHKAAGQPRPEPSLTPTPAAHQPIARKVGLGARITDQPDQPGTEEPTRAWAKRLCAISSRLVPPVSPAPGLSRVHDRVDSAAPLT